MRRNACLRTLLFAVVLSVVVSSATDAYGRLNLPQIRRETQITDQDHSILRRFFSSLDRENAKKALDDQVRTVLAQALPETFKTGCAETVNQWNFPAGATPAMSVRLLYGKGGEEGRPARALLSFSCFSKGSGRPDLRDERLISLVVDRDFSTLTTIADEKDCETCSDLLHIVIEKEVQIGGRTLVGLNFIRSNEAVPLLKTSSILREEKVLFYLFDDARVNPAGSVVKTLEERIFEAGKGYVTTTYSAGLVFKKDLKGNIVGILSPYTTKTSDGKSEKGMVRFIWDAGRKEFVKQ